MATLDSEIQGQVNIASGEAVTIRHLVGQLAELAGTPQLVEFGAIAPRVEEAPMIVADVTRLRREVEWEPEFDLARGLAQTLEFWRSQARSKRKDA